MTSAIPERREHPSVREIFPEASAMIAPFFAGANRWGNATLDHLAYRLVRELYPTLSFDEARVLVVASRRVHSTRVQAVAA